MAPESKSTVGIEFSMALQDDQGFNEGHERALANPILKVRVFNVTRSRSHSRTMDDSIRPPRTALRLQPSFSSGDTPA
jgi:hypothetical protein